MQINEITFDGLHALEIVDDRWRMSVVTQCGPRIAFLGRNDGNGNILYWDRSGAARGNWKLMGGHRVWLTRPMADESEDAYLDDNDECAVEEIENGLIVTAPAHPQHRLERGMRIEWLAQGRYSVTNFVKNAGDMIYSGGVWSPTCINPDGKALRIPLGADGATWDIVKIVVPRVFAGNTQLLEDPQVRFEGNDMVITPAGTLCKRCVCAPKGTVQMSWADQGITFTKTSAYVKGGNYPLGGCNLAVFIGQDNWMAEMESFGIEQSIIPGQTIRNTETWEVAGE